jgi:ABC-type multidrug transport system fused ATPase/permease subunit
MLRKGSRPRQDHNEKEKELTNTRQQQINNLRAAQETDDFDERFDAVFNSVSRNSGRIIKWGIGLWILGIIVSLALTGVIIWAIITLVTAIA